MFKNNKKGEGMAGLNLKNQSAADNIWVSIMKLLFVKLSCPCCKQGPSPPFLNS